MAPSISRGAAVSEFDAKVIGHLEEHLAGEKELLAEYQGLAGDSDNAAVRYLLALLLEDEQRHHRVLGEMLNQFRTGVLLAEQRPLVPWMIPRKDPAMAVATRRLLREERKDLRSLRRLRRSLGSLRRTSLNGVLVDSMISDTRKHVRYLRAIQRIV